MTTGDVNKPFRMGTWLVQPDLNRLLDGDRVITLEPRLMGVLACLASRSGKIVSADELLETVWHGRINVDNTIYQAVAQLRKVLGDDVHQPRYIETVSKKGYRLICPVIPAAADYELLKSANPSPSGWRPRRRHLVVFAGIASIAMAITLTLNPQFWNQLLQTNEGPEERSVAVLPFVDMSEDGSQQYLGDGVSEELIHVLSNLPDLRVTARTSSFAFRDSNEDIRRIGNKLNVATILEGSVRKDGDSLRVTSQLVDIRNGYHLWSQTFDRRTTDLFSIQNEIAVAVAEIFEYRELGAVDTDKLARPDQLQTYDLYHLGRHQTQKYTPSGNVLAIQHFERAIEMDPSFARAYAGLSNSYAFLYWDEGDPELLDKAESAAEYAIILDGQSAESFSALGSVKSMRRDYSGAEVEFRKAIALSSPNDVRLYLLLAFQISKQGRVEEALEIVKNALELYPMSGMVNHWLGRHYSTMAHGDWDVAFKYFKQAMDRDPAHRSSYGAVGRYYLSIGQLNQAIAYFSKIVEETTGPTKVGLKTAILASTYVEIGEYTSAANLIRRAKELEPNHLGLINSEIHLLLARRDFSAVRDIVHGLLPKLINDDPNTSLMAFYEMVIGDSDHAEDIYARLTATSKPSGKLGDINLYRSNELSWGMIGAVNLAYLHESNGETGAASELLVKAREYVESWSDYLYYDAGIRYVLAQIAVVEGNHELAIENFRNAVDAGWTKAWFGRIDPIMADLRKDPRFIHILEELEENLVEMRENPEILASNKP